MDLRKWKAMDAKERTKLSIHYTISDAACYGKLEPKVQRIRVFHGKLLVNYNMAGCGHQIRKSKGMPLHPIRQPVESGLTLGGLYGPFEKEVTSQDEKCLKNFDDLQ
jgi:hypothetical protein